MWDVIAWFFIVEAIGLIFFPIAFTGLPFLSDRGWGISKPLGLIVLGFLTWALSYLNVLNNSAFTWWLVLLFLLISGIALVAFRWKHWVRFLMTRWRTILVMEVLFLVFFFGFIVLRSHNPEISNTEKLMEIQLLNAATVAESAPPEDPWMSGENVAYYYGGYWYLAGIGKMSSVRTGVGFNLSTGLIAGMAATGIFSLVYNLVRRDGGSLKPSLILGITGAFLLLVVPNLAGWWEIMANFGFGTVGFFDWLSIHGIEKGNNGFNWRPDEFWWWFRASRIINSFDVYGNSLDYTIQEFPFFSLMLGDVHPHVISIPFVLTGLSVIFNVFLSRAKWGFSWITSYPIGSALLVLVIGSSGFINQADILLIIAIFVTTVLLKSYRENNGAKRIVFIKVLPTSLVFIVISIALFFPFYFDTLKGQIQFPPIAPAPYGSRFVHLFTVWGIFVALLLPFLLKYTRVVFYTSNVDVGFVPGIFGRMSRLIKVNGQVTVSLMSSLIIVGLFLFWGTTHLLFNADSSPVDLLKRFGTTLPLGFIFFIVFSILIYRVRQGSRDSSQYGLLLILISTLLIFGCELFFVNDLFGNRMNTIFKVYYQVWIILSLVSTYGLHRWYRTHSNLRGVGRLLSRTLVVLIVILLLGPIWYSFSASFSKASEYDGPTTINGWQHLKVRHQLEAEAIEWLVREANPGARIVEAVGPSYTEYGRISAATGLPTILGWPNHERQWRGAIDDIDNRERDVKLIYETDRLTVAKQIIYRYGIEYVIIGARERKIYPKLSREKFDILGIKVLDLNGMTIYRIKRTNG